MKQIFTTIVLALIALVAPASAMASGHDSGEKEVSMLRL